MDGTNYILLIIDAKTYINKLFITTLKQNKDDGKITFR